MDTSVIVPTSADAAMPGLRTLLIVDDHPGFRGSARALLEASGRLHVVGEAANGADAVQAAARLHPDIILLDIVLPDIDGIAVCELIMRDPMSQPAIVLTSSRDPASYGPRLKTSRARGFIAKDELSPAALLALAG